MKASALILFVVLSVSLAAKLPADFKRCKRDSPDLDDCLKTAIQEALAKLSKSIPELGLKGAEPLLVPALTIGAGSGAVKVQQNYKNVQVYGLTTLHIDSLHFDSTKKTLIITGDIPELKMTADYDVSGTLLLLPVQGSGPSTNVMSNVKVSMALNFESFERKGKKYFKVVGNRLNLEPEKVSYNFANLFNGDKVLGDNINKVLNENSKDVFDDVKEGFEKAYGAIIQDLTNSVFTRVPLSEVFIQ